MTSPDSTVERRNATSNSTPEKLMDAAEKLFAEQGIARASLRAITAEAGANLAAVHYHFGSKQDLVGAVLARRLAPLNRARLDRLDAYEAATDGDLEVLPIVEAFIAPVLRMIQQQRGGHEFARFVTRAMTEPGQAYQEMILDQFRQTIGRFTRALARALPDLAAEEVFWRFHFMVGAMIHTAGLGYLAHQYSGGLCNPLDVEGAIRRLTSFVAAGMLVPAPRGDSA